MQLANQKIFEDNIPGVTIIGKLDDGGQKQVFHANHQKYGDIVLKIVPDGMTDGRIQREIEIVNENKISNVPQMYNWGTFINGEQEILYIIEEYIKGISLRKYLDKNQRLPLQDGLALLDTLLSIAVELEDLEIVHRDIKPANIMVGENALFYLLDFGIARALKKASLTMTKAHFGPHTPGYAAPEQFRNLKKEIDIRADLFSIGVTAYEAIIGEHPFLKGSEHYLEMLRLTETVNPVKIAIQGDTQKQLMSFITILMDKFPSRRPPSAKIALDWYRALLPTIKP